MTKLLIAGGCSNTDQNYRGYVNNNVFAWPHIIAEYMGWDYCNVARQGAGNGFIADSIFDAINENKDRDIVVMSLWTEASRMEIFDIETLRICSDVELYEKQLATNPWFKLDWEKLRKVFYNYKEYSIQDIIDYKDYIVSGDSDHAYDKDNKFQYIIEATMKEWINLFAGQAKHMQVDKQIVDYSLRCIKRTKEYCDLLGIPNYHEFGLSMLTAPSVYPHWKHHDISKYEKLALLDRYHEITKYVSESEITKDIGAKHWKRGLVSGYMEETDMQLSCRHPNQKGMEYIAIEFLKKIDND